MGFNLFSRVVIAASMLWLAGAIIITAAFLAAVGYVIFS